MSVRAPCGAALLFAVVALLAGCRTPPAESPASTSPGALVPAVPPPVTAAAGDSLARSALAMLGAPYRFGGRTPAGFDCSGLIFYVHGREGFLVPRTAVAQRSAAGAIPLGALTPGDLVFFRMGAGKVDHVGLYVGDGRFVHAPRSARPVSLERLDDPYYRRRLVSAGRFWAPVR